MFYSPGKQYVVTMCSISQRIKIYCRLPALSIHCTLSLWRHTLILANNTFYYWTLQHTHSIIRFISCPACLRRGIWTDIRADIKEGILPYTWHDNIYEEHFIWEGDGIYVCWAWEKHLTFSWWYRLTSSYRNMGADSKKNASLLISQDVTGQLIICLLEFWSAKASEGGKKKIIQQ